MRTYTKITSRCSKCGYEASSGYIKSYVNREIGIRLVKCPKCHQILKSEALEEWAAMSSWKKLSAIAPRVSQTAVVLLGLVIAFSAIVAIPILSSQDLMIGEKLNILLMMLLIAVCIALIWRVILCVCANNSMTFLREYTASIRRTRNDDYVKKIYGPNAKVTDKAESIPSIIILTKETRQGRSVRVVFFMKNQRKKQKRGVLYFVGILLIKKFNSNKIYFISNNY